MKSLKHLLILAAIIYVLWKFVLGKSVPKIGFTEPAVEPIQDQPVTSPVQVATQKIKQLKEAIKETIPDGQEENSEEIIQSLRNVVDQFEKIQQEIKEKLPDDVPILISDYAVPAPEPTLDKSRDFVSITVPQVKPPQMSPLTTYKEKTRVREPILQVYR